MQNEKFNTFIDMLNSERCFWEKIGCKKFAVFERKNVLY